MTKTKICKIGNIHISRFFKALCIFVSTCDQSLWFIARERQILANTMFGTSFSIPVILPSMIFLVS